MLLWLIFFSLLFSALLFFSINSNYYKLLMVGIFISAAITIVPFVILFIVSFMIPAEQGRQLGWLLFVPLLITYAGLFLTYGLLIVSLLFSLTKYVVLRRMATPLE